MFGRGRARTRVTDVLLASVVLRLSLCERMTPTELVGRLTRYHEVAAAAVAATGGHVLRYVGDCSIAVWTCEPASAAASPARLARELVVRIRRGLDLDAAGTTGEERLHVGLARGACVVEEHGRRIVRVQGHAALRLDELPAARGRPGDLLVTDAALRSEFPGAALADLGGGAFCVADAFA